MEYSQRPRSGSSLRDLVTAVGTVLAVNALGALPSVFVGSDTSWIDRPWLFPIVWTALFTLMGVALYLVGQRGLGRLDVQVALAAFAGQFALNLAWTPVLFGLQRPGLGLLTNGALWVAIVGTIVSFDRVDRRAAAQLVLYLAWVSFAALLNYAIYVGWS